VYNLIGARIAREPDMFGGSALTTLLTDIDKLIGREFEQITEDIKGTIFSFADDEAKFYTKAVQRETDVIFSQVDLNALDQAVFQRGMDATIGPSKITIDEALKKFEANKKREVINAINDGVLGGETNAEIAARVGRIAEGRPEHQVKSLTRTAVNHAASMAKKAATEENQAFFKGDEWVSTLDSRTTLLCAGRDGNIYPIGEGPYPPAHWGACAEGTLIETDKGLIPIEHVKVGDFAMTHTGEFKRVYAVMAKPFDSKMLELENNFGETVRLTNDHPILTSIGYQAVGEMPKVCGQSIQFYNVFNRAHKIKRLKRGVLAALVKEAVLINSHNIKTQVSDNLVTYTVGSFTAGMSSAVKLNKHRAYSKISNILPGIILMLKRNTEFIKKVYKKLLMKSRICFKGFC